jgi:hypothetical protein
MLGSDQQYQSFVVRLERGILISLSWIGRLARGTHEAPGDQSRPSAGQITSIPSASGPFCPAFSVKRTRWLSRKVLNPARSTALMWTKTSLPP